MILCLASSEALLEQGFMQLKKLSVPQKKSKFLVVKEELTKQIKSRGISKFCPQIRYECTVCFHSKTSAWLSLKMPSLTQRKVNHRLEIVIAVVRDVPSVSVVHHSVIYQVSSEDFHHMSPVFMHIYALIVMSKIALYNLFLQFTVLF